MSSLKFTYDTKHDTGYLSLGNSKNKVAKTVPFDCGKYVDFNRNNDIVGIEFLGLPPELDVTTLGEVFSVNPIDLRKIETAMREINPDN